MTTPHPQAAQLLYLLQRKVEIEDDLKRTKEAIAAQRDLAQGELAGAGIASITIDGRTLYPKETFYASIKGGMQDELAEVLGQSEETAWLSRPRVHAGQLRSYLREILENGGALPEVLQDLVNVGTKVELAVKAAPGSDSSAKRIRRNLETKNSGQ